VPITRSQIEFAFGERSGDFSTFTFTPSASIDSFSGPRVTRTEDAHGEALPFPRRDAAGGLWIWRNV